jgi:hypothetical protein
MSPRTVPSKTTATVAVCLLLVLAGACTEGSNGFVTGPTTEPEPVAPPPQVVMRDPKTITPPAERSAYCLDPDTERFNNSSCPMIVYGDRSYWPLSYRDNRLSMAITGYDSTGTVVGERELQGARYVKTITVNPADSTIVLRGQSDREVTIRWSDLP